MTIQAAHPQTMSVLLFIDSSVADYQTLIDGAKPGTEVHTLGAEKDGLTQMVKILGGRSDIDAIHIISHGSAGELLIGKTPLTNNNLDDYADELAVVGSALSSDGDVLLYGCNVAAGSAGKAFILALAQAIGANVAASSNPTGATVLGGDWQLEIQTGTIQSSIALTDATVSNYAHLFTVENFNSDPGLGGFPATFTLNNFTYTISGGDGGIFKYNATTGVGNTGNIVPESNVANFGTTETLTVNYAGNAAFTFNSVAVFFGAGGATYTFTGKLGGSTVGTTTSAAPSNAFQTISFGGGSTVIDQLLITSTDFNPSAESMDDFDFTLITPTITSATYNASTNALVVTGTDMIATGGALNDIDVSKLTLTGEGGATYTLTTSNVEIDSATQFTVVLNAADQTNVEGLLNKIGVSAVDTTTFNIAAAANWNPANTGNADTMGNAVTVSNVQTPTITSTTYNANTGSLVVTGANLVKTNGATNDITANKLTFTGEGGATYTLTDTANVEITSGTAFTLTLSATDRAALNQIINKNGNASTSTTAYNLAAADDWNSVIGNADISDITNGITASNVATPTITSSTYDATTGALVVTGIGFLKSSGAGNDIVANKFTFTGEGGTTYTLTDSSNVETTSGTAFTISLSATDKAALNQIINKNGTTSTAGTTYNLAAAEDWAAGADAAVNVVDATGNGITVSNVAAPVITSSTYDATTGALVVTGTGFLKSNGAANDIVANKFTFTGEGGTTYTLTDSSNVETTSGTAFTITLSATDKAALNQIINKNGTISTGGTTYDLAAAEDWAAGADAAANVVDATGNGITVSNVAVPTITSATYDYNNNVLTVTGTGLLKKSGATNDIDLSKLTITGESGTTYTLTNATDVEISSGTSFTTTLTGADLINVEALLNKDGTTAVSSATYNLAGAEDWAAGADASATVADLTSNAITVSNYAAPTVTSATFDASTNVLTVTGTNLISKSGATNDVAVSLLTLTGEAGSYTLTSSDVEVTNATTFSVTLNAADQLVVRGLLNKNGTTSASATTYNVAAAEDWMAGAAAATNVADLTANGITVSNIQTPTITSATYDSDAGILVVTGANLFKKDGVTNDVDISTLTLTGGTANTTYTITSVSDIEITSATSFSITLSGTDKTGVDILLDQIGTSSSGGSTYNLAAADNWLSGADSAVNIADTTNAVTVSINPKITSATYDAAAGSLVVTGTNIQAKTGASNDIASNKLTFTGEGGATYTLTDSANVERDSATQFTVALSATDKAAINQMINKNGTISTSATIYNLAAADDWNANVTAADTSDSTDNAITASNVAAPAITSSTYNASTGSLVVTGTGFLNKSGAVNDIDVSKLTFTGEGSATYALTDSTDVEITSGTAFTVTLSATDKAALNQIINKNGAASTAGTTTYNLAAAEDWATGADAAVNVVDATGNGITASNVAVPTITSSTYNASTGVLVVTGIGFLKKSGATNDVDASLFTFTGEGAGTYTLIGSSDVEITSGTEFTITLDSTDKAAVNLLLKKAGTASTDATTYNLAAADDWAAGADATLNVADAAASITVTISTSGSSGGGGGGGGTTTTTTTTKTVDGTSTGTTTETDGSTTTTVSVVEDTREEDPTTPSTDHADIPVVTNEEGDPILTVSIPVGVGLNVNGQPGALSVQDAIGDLIARIEQKTDVNSEQRSEMTFLGRGFLASLAEDDTLVVQTITPTVSNDQVPDAPIIITASDSGGDSKQGLVIDVTGLPTGTVIQLDSVAFAAIVGAVKVVGGAGQNFAVGDNQNQFIVLGADDDVLFGGGGDDTVGSLGGDDQTSGGAGNDIVYGGTANDTISGGSGNDHLNGGLGFDVAIQPGQQSDYQITINGNDIILTHSNGEIDTLTDAELIQFASGSSLAIAYSDIEAAAHHLAKTWLGRDLTAIEGSAVQNWQGADVDDIIRAFHELPEAAAQKDKTADELLAGLDDNPNIIQLTVSREFVAGDGDDQGYLSLGLARNVDGGTGHDVLKMPDGLSDVHLETMNGRLELTRLEDGAMLSLINAEAITFDSSETVFIAHNTAEGILGRLFQSFFDRDATAVEWQSKSADLAAGVDHDVMLGEFQQEAGLSDLSDTDYVQILYSHTFGRQATTTELDNHLLQLNAGEFNRGWLAVEIASSDEAIAVIGNVILEDGWV